MQPTPVKTDVVVVGGGPAGLAAAIAARLQGFEVTVVDRRGPTIDKACGEGLMPDGAMSLETLGVTLPAARAVAFRGIRFLEGDIEATAYFDGQPGIGIRRTSLHRALLERAAALRVRCLWQRRVVGLEDWGVRLDGGAVRARYVIGADGQTSRVRRWAGLDAAASSCRMGFRRHYAVRPWTDVVEVHWSTSCEAYVTPVAANAVCIAMLTDEPGLRFDAALRRFPGLREHLGGAVPLSEDLVAPTMTRRCPAVVGGHVALIGDASGSVDAITGLGVALALREALDLAVGLRSGDLQAYADAHRRLMRVPAQMSDVMLSIDRHAALRHGALRTLARWPGLFTRLLALHAAAALRRRPGRGASSRLPRSLRGAGTGWTGRLVTSGRHPARPNP